MTGKSFQITQIELQKKNKDRVNIFLDGHFAFGLAREVVFKYHLHEGDSISEDLIKNVLIMEEKTKAKEKALNLLSYRARSVDEVKTKLKQRGFSEEVIEFVVKDLLDVGLLNDKTFAALYIGSRMAQKPMGKRLLRRELMLKGIDEEIIEQAIAAEYQDLSEEEIACQLIHNRIPQDQGADFIKKKKKITDFLFRRGFDWEVINTVIRKVLDHKVEKY